MVAHWGSPYRRCRVRIGLQDVAPDRYAKASIVAAGATSFEVTEAGETKSKSLREPGPMPRDLVGRIAGVVAGGRDREHLRQRASPCPERRTTVKKDRLPIVLVIVVIGVLINVMLTI
jgi:hypothetical protein